MTVEFGTGTLTSVVQVEAGSLVTSTDYRDYGRELILCERYCQWTPFSMGFASGGAGYSIYQIVPFRTEMRAPPSMSALAVDPAASQLQSNVTSNAFNATYGSTTGAVGYLAATAAGSAYTFGYRSLATAEL